MAKILKVKKTRKDSVVTRTVANVSKTIKSRVKRKETPKSVQRTPEEKKEVRKHKREAYFRQLGVLYLGSIPHGFYEEELKRFFGQFGRVLKVKLARSTVSGRSKGYAFIVFRFKEVADIAAETTNNYLMGKRILKAKVIPYEEVKPKWFWFDTPSELSKTVQAVRRNKFIEHLNKELTTEESNRRLKAHKKSVEKMMTKLSEKGICDL